MRGKEICLPTWGSLFIFFSTSWFEGKRHYQIWLYTPSHMYCYHVLSNLPLKFHLCISLMYSHWQVPSSRPRLWFMGLYHQSSTMLLFIQLGLLEHHFLRDTPWLRSQVHRIHISVSLSAKWYQLVIYTNSPQRLSQTGLHIISTPALASLHFVNVSLTAIQQRILCYL